MEKRGGMVEAKIAQLGERMTEDHKVRCSIHLLGAFFPNGRFDLCFVEWIFVRIVVAKKEVRGDYSFGIK